MTPSTKQRALTWSKEVERRTRDGYRILYPEAQRTKFSYREDKGSTDIIGTPYHVQVKARARTWVGAAWREARLAAGDRVTHLVTQDKQGEVLVTMRLKDWAHEMAGRRDVRVSDVQVGHDGSDEG